MSNKTVSMYSTIKPVPITVLYNKYKALNISDTLTYISIKIDPNGRTPPRIAITAGSINLQNIQANVFAHQKAHKPQTVQITCKL